MTPQELNKGVRAFLADRGGDAIDLNWFERAGDPAKELLFHILELPSTSTKTKATIKSLLVAAFFSPEVETRLLSYVRGRADPRVRDIDEKALRGAIANRDDFRRSLTREV